MTTHTSDRIVDPPIASVPSVGGPGAAAGEADSMLWTAVVQRGLNVMTRKWTVSIVRVLEPGPLRIGVLRLQLKGIQPKVLRETLRALKADGVVCQVLLDEDPSNAVGWALTTDGRSLVEPLAAIYLWSRDHMAPRSAADRRSDHVDGNLEVPSGT